MNELCRSDFSLPTIFSAASDVAGFVATSPGQLRSHTRHAPGLWRLLRVSFDLTQDMRRVWALALEPESVRAWALASVQVSGLA
jgi:hypothetical protein